MYTVCCLHLVTGPQDVCLARQCPAPAGTSVIKRMDATDNSLYHHILKWYSQISTLCFESLGFMSTITKSLTKEADAATTCMHAQLLSLFDPMDSF